MAETTDRPMVAIKVEWNPNTGKLDLVFANASAMEVIGILENAKVAMIAKSSQPAALPGSSIALPWQRR